MIGGETIPPVLQQPVKSLGRVYSISLTDRYQGNQVLHMVCDGLAKIDKCGLPGKYKAWCYQFGLLPRVLWPLQVYDIPLSPVERMEQKVSVKLRKWLGVPRSFNTNALYASSFKLSLPLKSLVEEYKAGKGRLGMMLKKSRDPRIQIAAPDLNTDRKCKVEEAIREAMSRLYTKEVIGAVADGK